MNDNIKIPRLEGDDMTDKQEIRVFCRQVVAEIGYLKNRLEQILEILDGMEG